MAFLTPETVFGKGSRETVERLTIIPFDLDGVVNPSLYTLPTTCAWEDFDELHWTWTVGNHVDESVTTIIPKEVLTRSPTGWSQRVYDPNDSAGTSYVTLTAKSATTVEATRSGTTCNTIMLVGCKNRKSTSSLEELLSVAAQPRLLHNTDMTHPVNQIGFDGNWSALVVDAQGWDLWRKYDATRMFQVVEDGSYLPEANYILQADGVVIWEGKSPASGHWGIALPNTSDKVDLRMGEVKVPWHPEDEESKQRNCYSQYVRRYEHSSAGFMLGCGRPDSFGVSINFPVIMRAVPNVTISGAVYDGCSFYDITNKSLLGLLVRVGTTVNAAYRIYGLIYSADATLKHADVTTWTVI
ncbi:hypothetical protein [Vibrio sp. TBV020]|uniref:hypothetical protein n=1 Tax=Vibrio sp. TBV020 TaxID=3137398 RepID=UPI0038CD74B3